MAQNLTRTYGPFYGGMLDAQQTGFQQELDRQKLFQSHMGMLAEQAWRQQQGELVRQQIEMAKLNAAREAEKQKRQNYFFDMMQQRMGGGGAPAGALPTDMPDAGPTLVQPQGGRGGGNPFLDPWFLAAAKGAGMDLSSIGRQETEKLKYSQPTAGERLTHERGVNEHNLNLARFHAEYNNMKPAERAQIDAKLMEMQDAGIAVGDYIRARQAPPAPAATPMTVTPEVQAGRDDLRRKLLMDELDAQQLAGNTKETEKIRAELARIGARPGPNPAPVNLPAAAPERPLLSPKQRREQAALEVRKATELDFKRREEFPGATQALRINSINLGELRNAAVRLRDDPVLERITGLRGKVFDIPGGDAATLRGIMETMKTQLAVKAIADMRATSPTGGAVGQVTEREWGYLKDSVAALQPGMNAAAVRKSLDRVISIIDRTTAAMNDAYTTAYGSFIKAEAKAPPAPRVLGPSLGGTPRGFEVLGVR